MNKPNTTGIISVILVYGIIFSEYYLFMFYFIPAYSAKYGNIAIFIGIEFTILYSFLHFAYFQA